MALAKIEVELIDHMGDDLTVVNAARVSFDKESSWGSCCSLCYDDPNSRPSCMCGEPIVDYLKEGDVKLIRYLAKHNHFTPFTHPQITLRETVPIFVARQRFKHVVGFTYNEVSRRYVDDEPEFYTPDSWRSRPDGSVKQGSGTKEVSEIECPLVGGNINIDAVYSYATTDMLKLYTRMLAAGVAPEQARMVLPQSMMTSYYVTGSLAAFARMVKQRKDPHAQKEIQDLAQLVDDIIRPLYPVSWGALVD